MAFPDLTGEAGWHGGWTPCCHRAGFASPPSTYFEILEPEAPNGFPPVMMVTGGVHSGACYLVTPDGRPGWAHDFLRAGYRVVLVDWPGVGRSGFVPPPELGSRLVVDGLAAVIREIGEPVVLLTHSISGAFGWKLVEEAGDRIAALVAIAPAPPGNMGVALGEMVRDEGEVKIVAMASGETRIDIARTVALSREFAFAKLVGGSSRFPPESFESYFGSLLGISGRIMFERTNIGGVQLQVHDTAFFGNKPILLVTGTDDIDHPRALDESVVAWLRAAGADADFLWLGDLNIHGNGHMMMLEENSAVIAGAIMDWLQVEGLIAR